MKRQPEYRAQALSGFIDSIYLSATQAAASNKKVYDGLFIDAVFGFEK
jgi:hypothetical protein